MRQTNLKSHSSPCQPKGPHHIMRCQCHATMKQLAALKKCIRGQPAASSSISHEEIRRSGLDLVESFTYILLTGAISWHVVVKGLGIACTEFLMSGRGRSAASVATPDLCGSEADAEELNDLKLHQL